MNEQRSFSEALKRKLSELSNSRQSAQTQSQWLIHHRKHPVLIVSLQEQELRRMLLRPVLVFGPSLIPAVGNHALYVSEPFSCCHSCFFLQERESFCYKQILFFFLLKENIMGYLWESKQTFSSLQKGSEID
uniref:CID domain-containing protein n=1 Tax=Gallus gallus TaxID=9031 RepID=A0A8V0YGE5_CHICK